MKQKLLTKKFKYINFEKNLYSYKKYYKTLIKNKNDFEFLIENHNLSKQEILKKFSTGFKTSFKQEDLNDLDKLGKEYHNFLNQKRKIIEKIDDFLYENQEIWKGYY